jgi:hypothetical protein
MKTIKRAPTRSTTLTTTVAVPSNIPPNVVSVKTAGEDGRGSPDGAVRTGSIRERDAIHTSTKRSTERGKYELEERERRFLTERGLTAGHRSGLYPYKASIRSARGCLPSGEVNARIADESCEPLTASGNAHTCRDHDDTSSALLQMPDPLPVPHGIRLVRPAAGPSAGAA